jgi:GTPase SAR1 family protein
MIVFDVTQESSINNVSYWIKNMKEHAPENVYVILVGNKCDLVEKRVVSAEQAEQIAEQHDLKYFETSAKENIGVEEAFKTLAEETWCKMMNRESIRNLVGNIKLENANAQKKTGCCGNN